MVIEMNNDHKNTSVKQFEQLMNATQQNTSQSISWLNESLGLLNNQSFQKYLLPDAQTSRDELIANIRESVETLNNFLENMSMFIMSTRVSFTGKYNALDIANKALSRAIPIHAFSESLILTTNRLYKAIWKLVHPSFSVRRVAKNVISLQKNDQLSQNQVGQQTQISRHILLDEISFAVHNFSMIIAGMRHFAKIYMPQIEEEAL